MQTPTSLCKVFYDKDQLNFLQSVSATGNRTIEGKQHYLSKMLTHLEFSRGNKIENASINLDENGLNFIPRRLYLWHNLCTLILLLTQLNVSQSFQYKHAGFLETHSADSQKGDWQQQQKKTPNCWFNSSDCVSCQVFVSFLGFGRGDLRSAPGELPTEWLIVILFPIEFTKLVESPNSGASYIPCWISSVAKSFHWF